MKQWIAATLLMAFCWPATASPIHVSPTGDDANIGTLDAPVATFQRAAELGNHILAESGGTYSGRDMRNAWQTGYTMGVYGDGPRPIIDGGLDVQMRAQNVTIAGYHFVADSTWFGISMRRNSQNITLENNVWEGFEHAIAMQEWGLENITIRDNYILDSRTNGILGGAYVGNLQIIGNVFDSGHTGPGPGHGHNIYLSSNANDATIRDNISIRSNHIGIRALGGGTITGNVVAWNALGMDVGVQRGVDASDEAITAEVRGNLLAHAYDDGSRGSGIIIGDARDVYVVGNWLIDGPRNAIKQEDVNWTSESIRIGDNALAGWPADVSGDAIDVVGVLCEQEVQRTLLDFDLHMGGAGTVESFAANVRSGTEGYDAPTIIAWVSEPYVIPQPASGVLLAVGSALLLMRRRE